jgi:hypothetical protein
MRTRIQLLTGENLPLSKEIPYSLNFLIADIRETDKRSGNFSKTIEIPSSKEADVFFKYAFNIDSEDGYNPNLKVAASIFIDDIEQINGFIQLMSIVNNDSNIAYQVQIKGNVTNIFQEWADLNLTTLDLSAYDHTYNKANQIASWSNPVGEGYVYPMIDYGVTNGLTFNVNNFYPAIYVKQYIDSAFALAGFTYDSTFFNTDFFKRLIIPFNSTNLKISQSELEDRYFKAEVSTDYLTPSGAPGVIAGGTIISMDTDVIDTLNQFNTSTYKFTATYSGMYTFRYNIDCYNTFSGITGSTSWYGRRNYVEVISSTSGTIHLSFFDTPGQVVTNASVINGTVSGQTMSVYINAGESVWLKHSSVRYFFLGIEANYIKANSTFEGSVVNAQIFDGNNFTLSNAIPANIKIKDFFKSIINMFNLYIETDKNITNHLIIEPRNEFYTNGNTIDWTDKLAIDRDITIEPMGELDAIEYRYQYKEDKDYFNAKYKASYDENYGTYRKIIENDFLKNVKLTEVIFSPTPLANIGGTDRILSQIITLNATGSISDIKACNIRILYYGGVKTTSNAWTYTSSVSGTTTETTYPYAGHVDEPLNPTLDLSYGVPKEVFYLTADYTNNNLYNKYYSEYIDEISDKNSKIVTAYLNLTPFDIFTLDFRNTFYIDKYHLRLNKISDYNFVDESLTKCEFIRIKKPNPFVSDNITIGGYDAIFNNGDASPAVLGTRATPELFGNVVAPTNVVENTIRGCVITGTNNYVGDGCENVIMDNCVRCSVPSGVTNVSLRNCTDFVASQSNTTYQNNTIVTNDALIISKTITIPSADVLNLGTTPYLLIDSPGAGYYIQVLTASCKVDFNTTAYLGTTLTIETDTANRSQHAFSNALNATVSRIGVSAQQGINAATDTQLISDKGIYLKGNPTTGDSDIIIYLTYRIIQE